jgi:hypothetical protein
MTILDPAKPAHAAADGRPAGPRAADVPAYVEKYRALIDRNGRTPDSFADQYPHVIRVTPTRARIWSPAPS